MDEFEERITLIAKEHGLDILFIYKVINPYEYSAWRTIWDYKFIVTFKSLKYECAIESWLAHTKVEWSLFDKTLHDIFTYVNRLFQREAVSVIY